jgi:hypothetical protein
MKTTSEAARIRITLEHIKPAPWREVDLYLSASLKELHDTIQAAFLWDNSHLWEFEVDEKRYGTTFCIEEGDDIEDAEKILLKSIIDKKTENFSYLYDFGDRWDHKIEIISVFTLEETESLPRLIDGKYRAPPDDIGGTPGYEYFLEKILCKPDHQEYEDYKHFIEDPVYGTFDPMDMKADMAKIFVRRLSKKQKIS